MKILAIDPGEYQSGWVIYDSDTKEVLSHGIDRNDLILSDTFNPVGKESDRMAIEMVSFYGEGMPVGKTIFDTVVWIGRFIERWDCKHVFLAATVYRRQVKMYLCNTMRAKGSNIRQAIIDRYEPTGGGKCPQVGIQSNPGPLYGITDHKWSALAIAITYAETILLDNGGSNDNS